MKNKKFVKSCLFAAVAFAVVTTLKYPDTSLYAADFETKYVGTLATGYTNAEYQLLASLKTADYGNLTVNEFNSKVWNKMESNSNFYSSFEKVFLNIKESDPLYQFVKMDLRLSCFEWFADQTGDTPNIGNGLLITRTSNKVTKYYEVGYIQIYEITNGNAITVTERSNLINKISEDFESFLNAMTISELDNINAEKNINDKLANIISANTQNGIKITGEVSFYLL